jgi:predicted nucleic-acid-binding protein
MINDTLLFDTYAISEILKGNNNYKPYIDKKIIINNFIFAEICYYLIREKYADAEEYMDRYSKFIASINPLIIKKAMKFRYLNKNKNLSMADCISYIMSKEFGIKFLTGDKEFENLENVEFVRK